MSSKIDNAIKEIDKVICRHINQFKVSSRGQISQDILQNLRHFVEHIMVKIYLSGSDHAINYEDIQSALKYVRTCGEWKDLRRFHSLLQISVSHYVVNEENSERLMLKYHIFLRKIKKLAHDKLSLNILANLDDFPINTDATLLEYYSNIADKVREFSRSNIINSDKYYIQKIKPFFVGDNIYYEVTFSPANDFASKFNRVIAYTSLEITDFYAVKLSLVKTSIDIVGKTMPITIIRDWQVAIRDCEFKNFTSIIRGRTIDTGYAEQQELCNFLTETGLNLVELLDFSDQEFQAVKQVVTQRTKTTVFFSDLEYCRRIITARACGANILRYMLYYMNNKIIKSQRESSANSKLSNLYLKYGCIPFDNMPFNSSLIGHNPKLGVLFACFNANDHKPEILARLVRNNAEVQEHLFTPIGDILGFDNIPECIEQYNAALYYKHFENSRLVIENEHIFINGYVNDTRVIIEKLKKMSVSGIKNYVNSVEKWLNEPNNGVDCEEKKKILTHMFENSEIALVYGSAGTGKSTLINHVAHFFADKDKLFLAQTNPAIDNLKRRVTASNCTFSTITKFVTNSRVPINYDVLIIDECSTVSNTDMRKVIDKAVCKLLILVGDSYQISSIRFGNWFNIARAFVPRSSIFELTKPYRSNKSELLELWKRVRNMDETILELITRQDYSTTLDASIFTPAEADEIILCLNYDGLYGINNINLFLQASNPNDIVEWGVQQYKINDPILFNDSNKFSPVIHNNMKGRIDNIKIIDTGKPSERIQFDVELDKAINGIDAFGQDFELLEDSEKGNSVIRFCVYKAKNADADDDGSSSVVVPFQVAYAVSIHKAQGLEYNSVKIVITDEIDELITHNIFYTAITRAKNKLKIYWTPEVEQKVLGSIKLKNIGKDVSLLKQLL